MINVSKYDLFHCFCMSEGVMHQVMGWDTVPANLINAEYQTEKGSFMAEDLMVLM